MTKAKKTVDAIAKKAVEEAMAALYRHGMHGKALDSVLRESFARQVERVIKVGI